jgi:hypothetical protein
VATLRAGLRLGSAAPLCHALCAPLSLAHTPLSLAHTPLAVSKRPKTADLNLKTRPKRFRFSPPVFGNNSFFRAGKLRKLLPEVPTAKKGIIP